MIKIAKKMIDDEEYSCVIVKNNEILHRAEGKGVKPLLGLYLENKEDFNGSFITDKVIGKAAASIIVLGKAKSAYGKLMSKGAVEVFEKYNIEYEYKELVEKIYNHDKSDICPLEKIALSQEEPKKVLEALKEFLRI